MKKILLSFGVAIITLPLLASAATVSVGETVSEKRQEIKDNFYVAGGNITVSSVIFGDLTAAGGTITIAENVSEDVAAFGGNVTLLGAVGEDVRIGGGNITIAKNIGGDLIVGGGTVTMLPSASVKKDLIAGAGAGIFDGLISGNAKIAGGNISINGIINGNLSVDATERLSFGPGAKVYGNLSYSAPKEIEIAEGTVLGEIEFKGERNERKNFQAGLLALIGAFFIVKLLALVITALLFVFLLPTFTRQIVNQSITSPGRELVRGFVVAVVLPVAGIVALISIVGFLFGAAALLSFGLISLIACTISGVAFGTFLAHTFLKSESEANWKHALWGVVLLQIVALVPIVGWAVKIAAFLITLGAVSLYFYQKLLKREDVA